MHENRRSLTSTVRALSLFILLVCCVILGSAHPVQAQNVGSLNQVVRTNTTWTPQNSPYNLTYPVTIAAGTTLTIEPGTEVLFNGGTLEVDGTLDALGTSYAHITFILRVDFGAFTGQGVVTFGESAVDWNSQKVKGSILEYCRFINNYEDKVDSYYGSGVIFLDTGSSSPQIFNDYFENGSVKSEGSSLISGNQILGGSIEVDGGSPIISNNTITIGAEGESNAGLQLSGNNTALVMDNKVDTELPSPDDPYGIVVSGGSSVIERNYVTTSEGKGYGGWGMEVDGATNPIILNNTFIQNAIGISILSNGYLSTPTVVGNNFEGDWYKNLYLGKIGEANEVEVTINATNNWWGSTNQTIIANTIYDNKDDYTLGFVAFSPYLTSPNPEAVINPNLESVPASSATPQVPEFSSAVFLALLMMFLGLATTIQLLKLGNKNPPTPRASKTVSQTEIDCYSNRSRR